MSEEINKIVETREIVVRDDGTKAIRVRRKKKKAPVFVEKDFEELDKRKLIQIAVFVIAFFGILIFAGGAIIYSNSKAFRSRLINEIETRTNSDVMLRQFRVNPATANASTLRMKWSADSPITSLFLKNITARISPKSFLGNSFTGAELWADSADVYLGTGKEIFAGGAFLDYPLSFDRYAVQSLDIHFGTSEKSRSALELTEFSGFPNEQGTIDKFRLRDGVLKLREWPELTLKQAFFKVEEDELVIKTLAFQVPELRGAAKSERGIVALSGRFKLGHSGAPVSLDVAFDSFPLELILGSDFGKVFAGRVSDPVTESFGTFRFEPGSEALPVLETRLAKSLGKTVEILNFPFLRQLSIITGEAWYETPRIKDVVSLHVERQGPFIKIQKLLLEERSKLVITGDLKNGAGGQISGKLKVGIPPSAISLANSKALDNIFGQVENGYRWVELSISGNAATPLDDFSEQFNGARAASSAKNTDGLETGFEALIEGR